ncbi:chromate resistance protein ChrB domain-containing protein [Microbulbifer sp. VAAF005]|uniref:chromate resistance protein ChrB domain-containing protein n=1 Tax=Microbulbifer sp. VAAF005 TaxID=3034230 RepID=UPI003340353B
MECSVFKLRFLPFFLLTTAISLSSRAEISPSPREPEPTYHTTHGLGPDKWASAWLLSQHLDPGSRIIIHPLHGDTFEPKKSASFDSEGATFHRTQHQSTFEVLVESFEVSDPKLVKLASVINDIEVNLWRPNRNPESIVVETAFRKLQRDYGEENITLDCYSQLFSNIYEWIDSDSQEQVIASQTNLIPDQQCTKNTKVAFNSSTRLVPEIKASELFDHIRSGKNVVFVDTRESNEFAEAHIPGAVNIPIRSLGNQLPKSLESADIIISYCVKDFRGFEMAKILRRRGLQQTAILNPYGIRGWIEAELPVAGTKALTEQQAKANLEQCINDKECIKNI